MSRVHLHKIRMIFTKRTWIILILLILGFIGLNSCTLKKRLQVSSRSMKPTLQPGQVVLVRYNAYSWRKPERWEIAAYGYPEGDFVALNRIVGMPGEKIQITNKGVFINGEHIELPPRVSSDYQGDPRAKYAVKSGFRIPEDTYFLLGDNQKRAKDSRFLGPIHKSELFGPVIKIFPLETKGPRFLEHTSGMRPTIEQGNYVVADRDAYDSGQIERWDIVVYKRPKLEGFFTEYLNYGVGRIVGLPKEEIHITSSGGSIDGNRLKPPSGVHDNFAGHPKAKYAVDSPYNVPAGCFFILGDNPKKAFDSRFYGALDESKILGKVKKIIRF